MEKNITINVGEEAITFKVTVKDYEEFINGVESKNKVLPMKRLLKNTVIPEDKAKLEEVIEQALTVPIAGQLLEAFIPVVEISVKK